MTATPTRVDWRAHLAMARIDYWFKNVFVLPGILVALGTVPMVDWTQVATHSMLGLLSICLVASSNYTLNEILDAPTDRFHADKRHRPIAAGRVQPSAGYVQWLVLMAAGLAIAWQVSMPFTMSVSALWLMACVYNVPPVRSKDVPYLDVLTEAVNNPLRMLAGWFIVTNQTTAPASLLLSYWMIGCYFMALKRYAELRSIGDPARAAAYRKSFAHYTAERLLIAIMFYATASMLFFGAFCMRYRMELILAFPFVALVMAMYLQVALKSDSAAQQPERLYRERGLMMAVLTAAVVMLVLLRIDLPVMYRFVTPTAPVQERGEVDQIPP
ncbi:MAG: UbiA prenyltransferase family protein [Gemmatimonadaceae bacterium]|nr:UbiA prenyltransferase family protein [Gemmatimonadaceae bacterium]